MTMKYLYGLIETAIQLTFFYMGFCLLAFAGYYFLHWQLPDWQGLVSPTLTCLRVTTLMGLFTSFIYMMSPEGKRHYKL